MVVNMGEEDGHTNDDENAKNSSVEKEGKSNNAEYILLDWEGFGHGWSKEKNDPIVIP